MPRYTQFRRSNTAGKISNRIDPGSFAVNWADRKIHVGGPSGEPLLFAYPLSDHRETSSYREQDVCYFQGALYRANVAFISPGPFNPNQWEKLTEPGDAALREFSGTVLTAGGALSAPVGGVVTIGAGTGIVLQGTPPAAAVATPVTFAGGPLGPLPANPNDTLLVGISASAGIAIISAGTAASDWYRAHIVLGSVTTDNLGDIITSKSQPVAQHQMRGALTDLIAAIGPFKARGAQLSWAAQSQVRVGDGSIFWQAIDYEVQPTDPNFGDVTAIAPLPLLRADRNGYVDPPSLQNDIDPANWDNGGVLSPVPADTWTTQFIFMNRDLASGTVLYGQVAHASEQAALDSIATEFDSLVLPDVVANSPVLGAFVTNADGTSQVVRSSEEGLGAPFGTVGGGGDTSQFLRLDGTRAMTGDLNLGGNALTNGTVDGENTEIRPNTETATGSAGSGSDGELIVNTTDSKVYRDAELIASHTEPYSATLIYRVGDFCIQSNNLYRCITEVDPPEAFDPAKWQLIGADNSGALDQAVLVAPTVAGRNTIDVTGGAGTTEALAIQFDNSQSVDLVDFSPNAKISRFGIPTGAFGEDVFRVSQVNHLFTDVGTPIFWNGAQWLLADRTAQSRFPTAIVHEVIDANNFLAQIGGRVNNLGTGPFGGAAPTPGVYYYAGDTPGQLVTEPVSGNLVPVLYTLTTTTAMVKLTGTAIPETLTPAGVVDLIYPVGSVLMTIDPQNPGDRWAGTTWVATAQGRAVVGVGNNGTSDWGVGEQRGAETHQLEVDEMPSHSHGGGAHTHPFSGSGTTSTDGDHTHTYSRSGSPGSTSSSGAGTNTTGDTGAAGAHDHTVTVSGTTGNPDSFVLDNTGSDVPHNNVQPSMAFYMWERTA